METKERRIYVTSQDLQYLKRLIEAKGNLDSTDKSYLKGLLEDLDRAEVVPSREVPQSVVTIRSRFRLKDLDTGEESEYTLVYPGEADIRRGKLSVLAPIGTAVLGYGESDTIEWPVPAGLKRFRIESIQYQSDTA